MATIRQRGSSRRWRVLLFLHGTGEPAVARALTEHGFTEADLDEGWRLLRAVEDDCFSGARPPSWSNGNAELDVWENHWFPVIRATLRRHHPEVRDYLFENLSQTRGVRVRLSVGELVARLRRLERDAPVKDGLEARALLTARGLTDDELDAVEQKLANVSQVDSGVNAEAERVARLRAADAALWAWYLEWSSIVRAVVRDRHALHKIGFQGPPGRPKAADAASDTSGDDGPLLN